MNVVQQKPNYFAAQSKGFKYHIAEQDREDYCWAACVKMVLSYQGIALDQTAIVQHIFGATDEEHETDKSATLNDILKSLNGIAANRLGRPAFLQATAFASTSNGIAQDIATNWPVIVGIKSGEDAIGHVCVLSAASFCFGPYNQVLFDKLVLHDPSPGTGRRVVSAEELNQQIRFAIRIRVTHG